MRFLVDANLSPVVAAALRDAGHDAVHVLDLGLVTADDDRILDAAAHDDRVIVTADADFGALLAIHGLAEPSVVLLRSADHLSPPEQAALLLANCRSSRRTSRPAPSLRSVDLGSSSPNDSTTLDTRTRAPPWPLCGHDKSCRSAISMAKLTGARAF